MTSDAPPRKPVETRFLDGGKLRKRREGRISQEKLAKLIPNADQSLIGHLEAGTKGCGIETIAALAVALECRPEDLMHEAGKERYEALTQALTGKAAA